MASKGEEKKNRRSGKEGVGKRQEQKEGIREENHLSAFALPTCHAGCWLPACSLANTAANYKEQPLSYSGGPFHVPYRKLY
jgi:hypothetical protein